MLFLLERHQPEIRQAELLLESEVQNPAALTSITWRGERG